MSKERLEELHKFYINGIINVDDLVRELVKLEQLNWVLINQNKHYREVLEFYANRENYNPKHHDPNSDNGYMSTIDYDEGEKARQALEESE